jgi:hypothetical protein
MEKTDPQLMQNRVELQLQCNHKDLHMSAATFPVVRTTAENRAFVESALRPNETLSSFIEQSVLERARWRKEDQAFYAEALRRSEDLKAGKSKGIPLEEVMQDLRTMLVRKRQEQSAKSSKHKAA